VYKTWGLGDILTSADLNTYIRDSMMTSICIARVDGSQHIGPGATTLVLWGIEEYDPDGMHSTTLNSYRFLPRTPGYYMVNCAAVGGYDYTNWYIPDQLYVLKNANWDTMYGLGWSGSGTTVPIQCNGTTDYICVYLGTVKTTDSTISAGYIQIYRLRG
jgi:hypothetical protein